MKPLLLACLLFATQAATAQSLDYISLRKGSGRVVKNFYTGSSILLQLTDGSYLQGSIHAIRNDSLWVVVYDIRYLPTVFGTYVRDTIATTPVPLHYKDIRRIQVSQKQNFWQRISPPLLMLGGGGYLVLNVLNGALYRQRVTDRENLPKLGTAAGAFGLGFLFQKLFAQDGFSKKSHRVVYVDL